MSTVLLDLDGTLSDNFVGIAQCIRHALERIGAPDPGDAELRRCVGPPLRESFARLVPGVGAAGIEAAIGHYRERYRDVGWRENVAYDGVADALAALARAGARLYVCTSKPEVFAARIVAHFGFDAHLARVYGADLDGRLDDKRALLAHLLASERLDAASAIMVGDRHHDVRAAVANGTRAVGVLWGYGTRDELAGAERLLARPCELATLVPHARATR
ncbi:MAG: HAD hydrolase-like protein [Burkholderiales bacterium]|nr:HAD hydrolase-like protein [Burkholderiales bacterium]